MGHLKFLFLLLVIMLVVRCEQGHAPAPASAPVDISAEIIIPEEEKFQLLYSWSDRHTLVRISAYEIEGVGCVIRSFRSMWSYDHFDESTCFVPGVTIKSREGDGWKYLEKSDR